MKLILAPVAALVLATASTAQTLGTWHESPSRPDVWFVESDVGGSWPHSRAVMEDAYPGLAMQLASFVDQGEWSFVLNTVASVPGRFFIGITDVIVEGQHIWLDGTPVTFTNWATGHPNVSDEESDFCFVTDNGDWHAIDPCSSASNSRAVFVLHSPDCDGNLLPDLWEIAEGLAPDLNGNGVPDHCDSLGSTYCTATNNSSNQPAEIGAFGDLVVANNSLILRCAQLPASEFGYFIMAQTTDFVPLFAGSQGNLCLAQPIVRLNFLPGGVLNSGAGGAVTFPLDLPLANQSTPILSGETWFYQYWTRDVFTSNTSNGLELMFQ